MLNLTVFSCDRVKEKTKETINQGGETVGKTATEFIEGVTEGVEKTLQCELTLSNDLTNKGLKTGKFTIESDSGTNNKLVLYIITEKDFNSRVTAIVKDKTGLETGRSIKEIKGKAGESGYFDFYFDKRTNIDVRSSILIQ